MSTLGSYKTWKPLAELVKKLTKKQIDTIEYENANWSSGLEGGRYDSNEGMRSSSFTVAWAMLSIVARGMPVKPSEEHKQHLHEYLLSLGHVLPCKSCRTNFSLNLIQSGYRPSIHLQSRQAFSRFVNHLHNTVNVMLGKPTVPYEELRDFYDTLRARCTPGKRGNEGSCNGPLYKNDKKATCIIKVVSEEEAQRKIRKNGGRISMSAECKLHPDTNDVMKQLHYMTSHTRKNPTKKYKSRSRSRKGAKTSSGPSSHSSIIMRRRSSGRQHRYKVK